MNPPKFKIGDRVKWKDSDWRDRAGDIQAYDKLSQRYFLIENDFIVATWWHESHLTLDIQETPKFKIGDRVKWVHFGKPSFGFIRARLSEGWWKVEYTAGCMENCHESGLSLDVPEAKQFATDLEAELGAEIINLHYDVADLNTRLTKEIGERHRERIAKEAAQREVTDIRSMLKKETYIGSLALGAQEELAKVRQELAEAIESTRSANAAYLDSVIKLSSVQKELAEVRRALVRERDLLADVCDAMLKQYI